MTLDKGAHASVCLRMHTGVYGRRQLDVSPRAGAREASHTAEQDRNMRRLLDAARGLRERWRTGGNRESLWGLLCRLNFEGGKGIILQ